MPLPQLKSLLVLLILVVVGMLFIWWRMQTQMFQTNTPVTFQDHQLIEAELAGRALQLEVVNTPASITQGLSDRAELGSDGMLFLLGQERFPNFWMRQMRFDLDLIWMRDNRVVAITSQVPHPSPGTLEANLPIYNPPVAVNQVLEVTAGSATAWGVVVGDQLEIK